MIHLPVAFALLLHVFLWGVGAAPLLAPRPWRRFWPVLIFPAGLGLLSAVVWLGAHAGWRGTDAYARGAEIIPLLLLGMAVWRHGARALWIDLSRFGLVWAAVAGALAALVLPFAFASTSLTTFSLGSCDAADYSAGARVLQEFARGDRAGYLGLVEVVRVHSVDNFFDYWLRLNHFTPSALIAFHASIFALAPHELTSLTVAVLLASTLPLVFWVARAVVGYSGGVALVIASLFGVNPVLWYAVAHVAPGQLLAAQAVALLTWAGVALWRGRLTGRRGGQFAGVLATGYWLVLGSYNFFLLVCLVPAVTYAAGLAAWRRRWARLAQWFALLLLPLAGVALAAFGRVAGLAERLTLLQTYDFGWKIPALTAEGWLGMVQGPDLAPWSHFGLRWILSAAVVGLLVWAWLRAAQQRQRALWLALALSLPVLAGYLFLQARGARLGTNASYDAYKLFAVFSPVLLPALCWWVTLRRSRLLHEWALVVGAAAVVGAFNLAGAAVFAWHLGHAPLRVGPELAALRRIEAMPDVPSVNLLIPDMWSRLWAHAFLLRREQYFETHTYEGRLNTPLRGAWDLTGGLVAGRVAGAGQRDLSPRFALVATGDPRHLRARAAGGWFDLEQPPGQAEAWQWTGREAVVEIENPHPEARTVRWSLDARGFGPRELTIVAESGATVAGPMPLGEDRARLAFPPFSVPPGRSRWTLHSAQPARPAAPGDPREIAVCVYRLAVSAGGH
jgi:hypothetical protein